MDANLKDILTENHESPSLHRLLYGNSISTRMKYNIIIILEGGEGLHHTIRVSDKLREVQKSHRGLN